MTEAEKAYIAGIIDGEGSIMLIRFHSKEYPSLCVSIASTTKQRAKLLLTKYKEVTPRNGRYSKEMLKYKLDFYEEFLSIK